MNALLRIFFSKDLLFSFPETSRFIERSAENHADISRVSEVSFNSQAIYEPRLIPANKLSSDTIIRR